MELPRQPGGPALISVLRDSGVCASTRQLLGELELLLCSSHLPLISNQSCLGKGQLIYTAQGGFFCLFSRGWFEPTSVPQN